MSICDSNMKSACLIPISLMWIAPVASEYSPTDWKRPEASAYYKHQPMLSKHSRVLLSTLAAATAVLALSHAALADPTQSNFALVDFQKPAWVSDLQFEAKGSYDDNVLGVSGNGLQPRTSWVDTFSFKVGVNFSSFLPKAGPTKALSLTYSVDSATYTEASAEDN